MVPKRNIFPFVSIVSLAPYIYDTKRFCSSCVHQKAFFLNAMNHESPEDELFDLLTSHRDATWELMNFILLSVLIFFWPVLFDLFTWTFDDPKKSQKNGLFLGIFRHGSVVYPITSYPITSNPPRKAWDLFHGREAGAQISFAKNQLKKDLTLVTSKPCQDGWGLQSIYQWILYRTWTPVCKIAVMMLVG